MIPVAQWTWVGVAVALLGAVPRLHAAPRIPPRPPLPPVLTPAAAARAEWLLRHRLPCQGCHEIGGTGGRVGPSLSGLGERRSRDEVLNILRDPQRAAPGTIMPRVPMSETTRQLIASYLVQRKPRAGAPGPVVRAGAPAPPASSHRDAAVLYRRFCAPCHGAEGKGDGYNARFLAVRPTAHADSSSMSKRSDDDLFDAIAGGGEFMDRSNLMPAFGRTLTRTEIRGLVHYLRSLCRCDGPGWSRADRGGVSRPIGAVTIPLLRLAAMDAARFGCRPG